MSESGAIARFDQFVDDLFENRFRGRPIVDRAFYIASELGDWSVLWHLLGTGQGLLRPDGLTSAAKISGALGLESAFVNGALKSMFRRTRPVGEFVRPHRLRTPKTTSFPSGHASSAMLAAAMLSHRNPKGAPVFYALAAIVATSRIHVRIHHASDVIGGAAVGIALGAIANRVLR